MSKVDRRKFIGGSDVAAILGISPFQTPAQLFFEKVALAKPEEDERDAATQLRRGKILEPVVRELVMARLKERGHDVQLISINRRYADPEFDFMACEIDAEMMVDGQHTNFEFKTSRFRSGEWGREEDTDEVPDYYHAQGLHGLMVTQRPLCIFGALFGLDDMTLYRIPANAEIIANIRTRELEFWNGNVLAGVPPPPSNLDDVKLMFARANGRPVEVAPEIADAVYRVREMRQNAKLLKDEIEQTEFEIARHVCVEVGFTDPLRVDDEGKIIVPEGVDNAVLTFGGRPIATWKKQRGAYLDQKRFKADHPEIHADLQVEHWFRVLRPSKV